MADLNKQELRRLAQCASTGPWKAEMEGGRMNVASEDWYLLEMHHDQPLFMTDAAFIAAASPATILALLDELERLESFKTAYMEWQEKTDWVRKDAKPKELGLHVADVMTARITKAEAERDAALAELEACKRGRPLDLARFDFGGPIGAVSDVVMGVGIGALLEPAKDDGEGGANG